MMASEKELPERFLVVLGVAQDAGYPQIGCTKECCTSYWKGQEEKNMLPAWHWLTESQINTGCLKQRRISLTNYIQFNPILLPKMIIHRMEFYHSCTYRPL